LKAVINKILHHSVVDGPGNRAVVFFQGCNFHCAYCHNPETISLCCGCGHCVELCPTGALSLKQGTEKREILWDEKLCCGCDTCIHECPHLASPRTKEYTPEEVMESIKNDLPFIRGLTVSGGECSLQRDFVLELFRLAKEKGLSTLMDSNGTYDYQADPELLAVCDGVMLDVKAFDAAEHEMLTGMANEQVLKNAVFLAQNDKLEEIRTVVVPGYLNYEETVEKITAILAPFLKQHSIRYKLIAYRPFGVRFPYKEQFSTPDQSHMQKCRDIAEKNGFTEIVLI